MLRADKGTHPLARSLVSIGHSTRKVMYTAMDIGVMLCHKLGRQLDNLTRLLRRSTAIEIDKLTTIDLAAENWEIFAYLRYIEHSIVY